MTSAYLQQWIEHPDTLDRGTLYELRTLVARYPYFQSLRLLYLKNLYLLHDVSFGVELRKSVLYVADRRVLFYLIEGERFSLKARRTSSVFSDDLETEPNVDRTLSLIDAFLATIPEEHSRNSGLDYAMDYTAYLMQEDEHHEEHSEKEMETPPLYGHELIDGFIRKSKSENMLLIEAKYLPPEDKEISDSTEELADNTRMIPDGSRAFSGKGDEEAEEEERRVLSPVTDELDDTCFTETLAKIYIKQHRYDKALEIIKKLSLNYPKKNAYFADQIRFLEKLIINAKSK